MRTIFELLCFMSFIGGGVVLVGTALNYLDMWLDGDIAEEQAAQDV